MKQKNLIIILITIVFSLSLVVSSAWAGSKQRHRWEGVAIGIGAAVLGSALLNNYSHPPAKVVYRYGPPRHRHYYRHRNHGHYRGHYKHRRYRVSPDRRVWNPGHYNPRGYWVPGRWVVIDRGHDHRGKDRARIDRHRDHRRR